MSPDCVFVLDHYNDYISGELDSEKVTRVEDHIRVHNRTVGLLRIHAPASLRSSISSLIEKI